MTPPAATTEAASSLAAGGDAPLETPVASRPALVVLRKRADFIAASKARRTSRPGLNLQGRRRGAEEAEGVRVGFTCSKKVGNAVARNRAKRRLRAAAAALLPALGRRGWDYVVIGRPEATAARPFDALRADLASALRATHRSEAGADPGGAREPQADGRNPLL